MNYRRICLLMITMLFLLLGTGQATGQQEAPYDPQSTYSEAITYQGQLKDINGPVNGTCDLRFTLWDAGISGSQVGSTLFNEGVELVDGLFTARLDFGYGAHTGAARWLEVAVRCPAGNGSYVPLSPRHELMGSPYALSAPWSGLVGVPGDLADGDDDTLYTPGAGLTLSGGQFSVNFAGSGSATTASRSDHHHDAAYVNEGQANSVNSTMIVDSTLSFADLNRNGCGTGQIIKWNGSAWACAADKTGTGSYWSLSGNAGTTPGTDYLGTSDNVAMEFKVNNTRALRIEPSSEAPNLIGGWWENYVIAGVRGATIAGGGSGELGENRVTDDFGTVGGGIFNQAGDGAGATSDRTYTTVGGGYQNTASGDASTVGGGRHNTASYHYATIGGGTENSASNWHSSIAGGLANTASGDKSSIGGGHNNVASGFLSTISGGFENTASGDDSFIGGGVNHNASGRRSTITGGEGNTASGWLSTVGGGYINTTSGAFAATVGGGRENNATDGYGVVAGGWGNQAGDATGTVDDRLFATVGGGLWNIASGTSAVVAGGDSNIASGYRSTVPGGVGNVAAGDHAFAAGRRAKANHNGAFVWADSLDVDFASTNSNTFRARATNGAEFVADNYDYYGVLAENFGAGDGLRVIGHTSHGTTWAAMYAVNFGTSPGVYADTTGGTYSGYFQDDIYVAGNCVGCTLAYVAYNQGTSTLEAGDLVAVSGLSVFGAEEEQPALVVHLAQEGMPVIGVVLRRAELVKSEKEGQEIFSLESSTGAAVTGDYLFIAVQGIAQVKVDAGDGAIQPGQRLTVSEMPGQARALQTREVDGMLVTEGSPVIGIALSAPEPGNALIPVFVNLQ